MEARGESLLGTDLVKEKSGSEYPEIKSPEPQNVNTKDLIVHRSDLRVEVFHYRKTEWQHRDRRCMDT